MPTRAVTRPIALSLLAACTTPAAAQLTILNSVRLLDAESEIRFTSGNTLTDDDRSLAPVTTGRWADAVNAEVTANGGVFSRTAGSMDAIVSPWRLAGRGDVSMMTIDDGGLTRIAGEVEAYFFAFFEVTERTDVFINLNLGETGNGAPQFRVSLSDTNGTLFNQLVTTPNVPITQTLVLEPGTHSFTMQARISWNGNVDRDIVHTGFFDGGLFVVPAPSTAGMLIAGGLLATRRRR